MAAVAVSSAAFAQATITGTLSYSYQQDLTTAIGAASSGNTNTNPVQLGGGSAVPAARTSVGKGKGLAMTDASIRIAASEDLGGGLTASGDMTWEAAAQRGFAVTRADAGLALSGGFGSVAIRNTRSSDLIAGIGSSAISLPDGLYDNAGIVARANIDTVTYTLPTLVKGLTLSAAYIEANDGPVSLPTAVAKSSQVFGGQYAAGPVTVRAQIKQNDLPAGSTVKKQQTEFAVIYNAGFATVAYAYDDKQVTTATDAANGYSITVPMGAVSIGAQQFSRGKVKQTEYGVKYDLSKRTSLTASQGEIKGTANTGATLNGTQYRVRLGHTF